MSRSARINRRDALKLGLLGSAALALPFQRTALTAADDDINDRIATSLLPKPYTRPFATPPVLQPIKQDATTDYYQMWQMAKDVEIIPGKPTTIYGYNGITPGPTIVAQRGRPVVMQQINALPQRHEGWDYTPWTSTHLHGSASLPEYDGYASDVTKPGQWKNYKYPNFQDARTLWYHDHGVHHTAENAYMGLAGMYIMHDSAERALNLPRGAYDVPLILKDAMFHRTGRLLADTNSDSGIYGDVIMVNGVPWPFMQVERRKYRFRVLNACISRSYRLRLNTGDALTMIGTDGGLMPSPVDVVNFRIAPGERYEFVIDFAKYPIGTRLLLNNVSPPNNIDEVNTNRVMAFDVARDATSLDGNSVPAVLNTNQEVMGLTAANAVRTRTMKFQRSPDPLNPPTATDDNEIWTVNAHSWQTIVDSGYTDAIARPREGEVEVWRFVNSSSGWFHPVHVHLVDYKILSRNGAKPFPYERGPKDVVYLGEGETVDVVMRFTGQRGKYMIHCHNLIHEDHDMMTQFEVLPAIGAVGASATRGHDPILTDPAQDLPAPPL